MVGGSWGGNGHFEWGGGGEIAAEQICHGREPSMSFFTHTKKSNSFLTIVPCI
jgi:hypothetical protein